MAIVEGNISVGSTGKVLDTTTVVQTDSTVAHREAVTITDGENLAGRALVDNAQSPGEVYGLVTRPLMPLTAFGELAVAQKTPQVQFKFPYGVNSEIVQSLTNHASSSVSATQGLCSVICAGAHPAFSQIRSKDTIRYGPGQGAEAIFTALFTTGVVNSSQVAGAGDDDEGLFFGYNGTAFGILHRKHGSLEVRELSITGAADAGGGDFTVTMDGTPVTITVGASATIPDVTTAIKVAEGDFANAGRGWETRNHDNQKVQFVSLVAENATGTFSFADVDSGVTAGTFTQATTAVAGLAPTETWTAQANWNVDPLDGTGPSGMIIDPTQLNVFRIQFQYLGGGDIFFYVEDKDSGKFQLVHRMEHAGDDTTPTFTNPTFHMTCIAKTESGYSGGALTIKTASMGGFIEGMETEGGVRHATSNAKSTTGTTPVNILTIHNEEIYNGAWNKIAAFPDRLAISSEAGKTVTVVICANPDTVGGTASYTDISTTTSVMAVDTAGTTVSGGTTLLPFTVQGAASLDIDLKPLNLNLRPGDRWVMTAELSSGADADVKVGITWLERV